MKTGKKETEAFMLAAARRAGVPIPAGEIPSEQPDFRFDNERPPLGIELSEVLRPACSNHGILPVEEEAFHKEIVAQAQTGYHKIPGTWPTYVSVFFTNTRGAKLDKSKLTRALTDFVQANVHRANPFVTFGRRDTPHGFDSIVISRESKDWWCGEGGSYSIDDTRAQLASRISAKQSLLPTYRAKLPPGACVWLLLYSGVTVSRSMMIPHGVESWIFRCQFDRVYWFTALEGQFVELSRVTDQ